MPKFGRPLHLGPMVPGELGARTRPDKSRLLHSGEESARRRLAGRIHKALAAAAGDHFNQLVDQASELLNLVEKDSFIKYSDLLVSVCAHLFEVGQSTLAINYGKSVSQKAEDYSDLGAQRRIANILGAQFCDTADFATAMKYLEVAVTLARKMGNQTMEAACLANVIVVLQEMGHYRQAITMADKILKLDDQSDIANSLKLQCSSNGLFAAYRMRDVTSASRFLQEGQKYLNSESGPLRRAFFEKSRVAYLVGCGRAEEAKSFFLETLASIGNEENPRIRTLLTVAAALCDWGLGDSNAGRTRLGRLHQESQSTRLYHHFVLQALITVYSNADTPSLAAEGLKFARELVEFTTSVKKAKFYRQLATRRDDAELRQDVSVSTSIDPFSTVRDWLSATDVVGLVPDMDKSEQRVLTKHEELTAIHEDMARLRVTSLRREIRTDAVNTAENWAIAAEFFDDETGQHCYRVGHLASMLARAIGMDDTFCVQVEHAARLHDIGKIAVNEVILLKPGPLDASEMAAMRLHTEVGAQILSGSDDPTLMMAVDIARHHHEWWNGAGYPTKSCGKEIPLSARVCAYADVYDALTHARSYKRAWTHERAIQEIVRLGGVQFDPDLLRPFCSLLERYRIDLSSNSISVFADMQSNTLIASRKKLLETIEGTSY